MPLESKTFWNIYQNRTTVNDYCFWQFLCTFKIQHLHRLHIWAFICVGNSLALLNSLCVVLHLSISFLLESLLLLSSSPEPSFTHDILLIQMITTHSPVRSSLSQRFICLFLYVLLLSPQACGPQYGYMCGTLQYISGVCANVSPSFQILNSIAPGVQSTQLVWVTHSCSTQDMMHLNKLCEQENR